MSYRPHTIPPRISAEEYLIKVLDIVNRSIPDKQLPVGNHTKELIRLRDSLGFIYTLKLKNMNRDELIRHISEVLHEHKKETGPG